MYHRKQNLFFILLSVLFSSVSSTQKKKKRNFNHCPVVDQTLLQVVGGDGKYNLLQRVVHPERVKLRLEDPSHR